MQLESVPIEEINNIIPTKSELIRTGKGIGKGTVIETDILTETVVNTVDLIFTIGYNRSSLNSIPTDTTRSNNNLVVTVIGTSNIYQCC